MECRVLAILSPTSIRVVVAPPAALNAKVTGPVFNDYDLGGYLIFRGIPTFIDGRTLPFGKDFSIILKPHGLCCGPNPRRHYISTVL
jgi:hypothetical protein